MHDPVVGAELRCYVACDLFEHFGRDRVDELFELDFGRFGIAVGEDYIAQDELSGGSEDTCDVGKCNEFPGVRQVVESERSDDSVE